MSLDKNNDGYISINEYLDEEQSLGPLEQKEGLFEHYQQSSLATFFILSLIRNFKGPLHQIVCIPNFYLCIYKNDKKGFYTRENWKKTGETSLGKSLICPPTKDEDYYYGHVFRTLGRVFILNAPVRDSHSVVPYFKEEIYTKPVVLIPPNLKAIIYQCQKKSKRFLVCSLSLYKNNNLNASYVTAHSNMLIFDIDRKTIERFDPHGNQRDQIYNQRQISTILKEKFKVVLPDFKYYGLNYTTPRELPGPQIVDAFSGVCGTWSTMYVILRLLNPNMEPREITKKMLEGTQQERKQKLLRFQKFIIKTLQKMTDV
jgi:hypothetical protein